jgi:hypothetical protein
MSYRKFRVIIQDVQMAGEKKAGAHRMFTLLAFDSHSVIDISNHIHDMLKREELAEDASGNRPELILSDYMDTE